MIFAGLDKKLRSLEGQIKKDLIDEIKSKGHQGKGLLIDSITVRVVEQGGDYNTEIECADYIQYLDHGKFLQDFLQKQAAKLERIISDEAQKDLVNMLKNLK